MNSKLQVLDFNGLVGTIHSIDAEFRAQASRVVNLSLTLRNWLIGQYIILKTPVDRLCCILRP